MHRPTWKSRLAAGSILVALAGASGSAYAAVAPVSAITPTAPSDTVLPMDTPAPKPAPVLVVRSYETSVDRVLVGSRFKLTLNIYNATSRKAENVVVSLAGGASAATEAAVGSGGLTVLGTGNAKYVGTIKGTKAANVVFDVMAGPGTMPGTYAVPVTISFEYNGERQEVAYTVGVIVERDAAFSVVTAEYPKTAVVGAPFDASFEVANTGGFQVSGVTLSVEASAADVVDGSLYLGTFDVAGSETIDVSITPDQAGTLEIVFVVSYRDDFGRQTSFRQPYRIQVGSAPDTGADATNGPGEEPAEQTSGPGGFVGFIMALLGLGS